MTRRLLALLPTWIFFLSSIALLFLLHHLLIDEAKPGKRPSAVQLQASISVVLWWASIWQVCVLVSLPRSRWAAPPRVVLAITTLALGLLLAFDGLTVFLFVTTIVAAFALDGWQRHLGSSAIQGDDDLLVSTACLEPDNAVFVFRALQRWMGRARSETSIEELKALVALPLRDGKIVVRVSPRRGVAVQVMTVSGERVVWLQVTGSKRHNRDLFHRIDGMLSVFNPR